MSAGAEVSVYDRMCWPEAELSAALAGGAHRRELMAYFGEREYRLLAALARRALQAQPPPPKPAELPRIYLLPGLLGSQLGWPRGHGEPPDLLWLDPYDVVAGGLTRLRPQRGGSSPVPLGLITHTYLALQLRLQASGLSVVTYDYDWRHDVSASARALATRLERDPAESLILLGHSMGGLLARAALELCAPATRARVTRVIGLGAPHGGSIGAVQALRATYPVLLRLAALDRRHDASTLTAEVFRSFLSLYQMLPAEGTGLNLFDPASWPASSPPTAGGARLPRPDRRRLESAQRFLRELPPADARFVSIVGIGQRTVTGLAREAEQFVYEISDAGDGTVPAERAVLAAARSYSLDCEHSELPRSARVARAIIELAVSGRSLQLRAGVQARKGRCLHVSDAMLTHAFERKLDWQQMSTATRRRYLNRLNAPPRLYAPRR
jgi:pimeloyl-ACP methyl ester carboxylesterase